MYDPLGWERVAAGQTSVAGWAAAKGAALGQQFRPCSAVHGAVDSAAAQEARVSGVDDGIAFNRCDIAKPCANVHAELLCADREKCTGTP